MRPGMMRGSVLVVETLRGLAVYGRPQTAYFYCLIAQAIAVVLWWPKNTRDFSHSSPLALFAVLIALGATLSYHSMRVGAEEVMFSNQQSIREWLIATKVPLSNLYGGYLVAHIIQTLYWILLSCPLVVVAWSVDGGNWRALAAVIGLIALLSSVFRMIGVCIYLAIGQYGVFTWYSLRVILLSGLVLSVLVMPVANFWEITERILEMSYTGLEPAVLNAVATIYFVGVLVFGLVAAMLARRIRSKSIR